MSETKPDGVFDLVRKADPNQLLAIHTREDVFENCRISFGSRLLFGRLLDMALNPHLNNDCRGQIIISILQLSERLGASERTIARWVKELVAELLIWISKIPRPNTKPINCYHITAFQPLNNRKQEVPGEGLWGDGYRRSDELGKDVHRGTSGQFVGKRFLLVDARGNPLRASFLENTPARGQKVSLRADTDDRSERSKLTLPADTSDRAQVTPVSVQNGHTRPLTGHNSDRGQGAPVADLIETQIETESVLDQGKANPPQDGALEEWVKRLGTKWPRELQDIKTKLLEQRRAAVGIKARVFINRKIQAVDEAMLGPTPPDEETRPKPARQAPERKTEPTEEELLVGARYLIESKQERLLTDLQKAALRRAAAH